MKEETLRNIVGSIFLIFALVFLLPFMYAVIFSFKTLHDIYATNAFSLPSTLMWRNYVTVWVQSHLSTAFINSLTVAASVVALTLILCSLAAYPISTSEFRGRRIIFLSFVIGLMFPWPAFMFAILTLFRTLGLINNLLSVIILYTALNMPFSIIVLTGFFRTIPTEYLDAARIDGASETSILWNIFLPLCTPIIVTLATLIFSGSWNEFTFALILLQNTSVRTIPVALLDVQMEYEVQTNLVMASSVMATIIPLIIFVIFYRRIVEGLTIGLKF